MMKIKVESTDVKCLSQDERNERIYSFARSIASGILDNVSKGQSLETAICYANVGIDSDAMRLQHYVAADEKTGWQAPDPYDSCTRLDFDYNELVKRGCERILFHPLYENYDGPVCGFSIAFQLVYGGRLYVGRCKIYVPRFKMISRWERCRAWLSGVLVG